MWRLHSSARLVVVKGSRTLLPCHHHVRSCSQRSDSNGRPGFESELMKQYDKDGFVIVRKAIAAGLVRELQGHADWLLHRFPELPPEHLHHPLIEYDAFWLRVVSDPALLALAGAFVSENIALFASHYFCKMPRTGKEVLWHQDGAYWPLKPMEVASLWLAVDSSSRANGCLRVVRGSHKQSIQKLTRSTGENVLSSYTEVEVDEKDVVDIELEPGDVEIHHPNIIHGSKANKSNQRRCGLTIRYIPTSTLVVTSPDDPVVPMNWLLSGKAVPAINSYLSWPAFSPVYSYRFNGCEEWNERPEVSASALQESRALSEDFVKQTSLSKAQRVVDGLRNE